MAGGLTLNGSVVSRMQTRRQRRNPAPPSLFKRMVYKCKLVYKCLIYNYKCFKIPSPMKNIVNSDSVLVLHLQRHWFDLFADGVKKCEYRDLYKYNSRFRNTNGTIRHFDYVVFGLDYPRFGDTSRWLAFEAESLYVGEGVLEWGAVPGVIYWCIPVAQQVDVLPWLYSRLLAKRK